MSPLILNMLVTLLAIGLGFLVSWLRKRRH